MDIFKIRKCTLIAGFCLGLSGLCIMGSGNSLSAEGMIRYRIAVITFKPEGFHNSFWDAIQAGARKAAAKLGVDLTYMGMEPGYEDRTVEGQSMIFRRCLEQGYHGIAFTPADRIRMAAPVRMVVSEGMRVVAIDSAVDSPLLSGVFASNNYEGGRLAAQTLAAAMGSRGDVAMLAHPARENRATRDRELALESEFRNVFHRIRLVSADRFGGATPETDLPVARKLLEDFPGVKGLYAVSGSGTEAFMRALEEKGLAGKVRLVGWDASPATLDGLRRGTVTAILQQNPERMGYEAVHALVEALDGRETREMMDTGVTVITRENMDSPQVRALISPDYSGWVF